MRAKISRNRAITSDDDNEAARPIVRRIVQLIETKVESRVEAYRQTGARIHEGSSWVRRVASGNERVVVRRCTWLNIKATYSDLVEQFEAAAEHERQLEELLRREEDASPEGDLELVARPALTDRSGAST